MSLGSQDTRSSMEEGPRAPPPLSQLEEVPPLHQCVGDVGLVHGSHAQPQDVARGRAAPFQAVSEAWGASCLSCPF